ncbi:KTSC domain-containing protein [Variovorax sp. PMC12]|nr:KTSC domain-containing protein [Variovorax sp. PMC12]
MKKTYTPPAPFTDPKEYRPIPLVPVSSGQVKAIGYDAPTKTLAVTFNSGPGTVYHYPDVESKLHEDLINAESIGTFFGAHIKPRSFKKFEASAAA